MGGWLDLTSAEALLVRGRTAVVGVLRSAAGALHALADAVDVAGEPVDRRGLGGTDDEPPSPGIATRQRIGEALQRARSRYDAVGDRPVRRRRRR
jgi:hypothetical protein